jgi:hypothetical protein
LELVSTDDIFISKFWLLFDNVQDADHNILSLLLLPLPPPLLLLWIVALLLDVPDAA